MAEPDNGDHSPFVTAIMPFSNPSPYHTRPAQAAIRQFLRQSYPSKQLVIVNYSGVPLLDVPCADVRELLFSGPRPPIGVMRNLGIDHSNGDWLMPWDSDDYFHPNRIAFQMSHRAEGKAVLLGAQIRIHMGHGTVYVHREPTGIPGTILFPAGLERYPALDGGDDVAFWMENWSLNSTVAHNEVTPYTMLSIANFHGSNLLPADQFLVGQDLQREVGVVSLNATELGFMLTVLKEEYNYNAKVN